MALNTEFHVTIARCSGNGVFESFLSDICEAMANQSNTLNLVADRRKESGDEHARIFDAIERGSAEDAAQAMTMHLHGVECALGTIVPGGGNLQGRPYGQILDLRSQTPTAASATGPRGLLPWNNHARRLAAASLRPALP